MSVCQKKLRAPRLALIAFAVINVFAASNALAQKKTTVKSNTVNSYAKVVLSDIVVQGLQRSDPASVFNILPIKVGESFSVERAQEIKNSLNSSGLYENVDFNLNGSVLVVNLTERSVISEFTIKGMRSFDKKMVADSLRKYGFAQGLPYDPQLLEKVKEELKATYNEAGLVNATITSNVSEQSRKQVAVVVTIDEGKYLKIKKIAFTGNDKISSRRLRSAMELNKNGIFSWYSKDSRFAPERLKSDLEAIRTYYLDRGFLEFDYVGIETPTTDDGKGLEIHVAINEGPQYRVGSVRLEGDTKDTPRDDVENIVKYRTGAVYSRAKISSVAGKVSDRLSKDGYALARVDAIPELNKADNITNVAFTVDPQERTYVRHVMINGNSRTKDEVIRREVRQMEGSLYSGANVQLSRDRIDRLGYFNEVMVETVPVPGTNNQVDIVYSVKENPTGELKLGLGYSSSDKLGLNASVQERNFRGSGNSLGVNLDLNKASSNFSINSTNPYFTKTGISRDFSLYYRTYDALELEISDSKYTTVGTNLIFGVPISERHKLFFGLNPEVNKIKLGSNAPLAYVNSLQEYTKEPLQRNDGGYNSVTVKALEATVGWSYDTRNSGFLPTRGIYQRVLFASSALGTAKYVRGSYQLQSFTPIGKKVTLAFNTQLDYGKGLNGQTYPFFKNLYTGGIGSVRGYETSTVGPIEVSQQGAVSYLGGSKRANVNVELQFPFPGMSKNKAVRLFVFADAGGLWGDHQTDYSYTKEKCDYSKITVSGCNGLRYSYGLGLTWNSPIGPLKFSYALPISPKEIDRIERFQFQIGTTF